MVGFKTLLELTETAGVVSVLKCFLNV